jgi:hypothetical protein
MFEDMGAAWRLNKPIPVRNLGENRFILEFRVEEEYKYVINDGPWRHKGDALLVVPYDGFSRPSEVIIDSINLCVRFYDVPVTLMSAAFTAVLARKVSNNVLAIEGPVKNFLRARVVYPLAEPLKPTVEATIKKMGTMNFDVKYEDVPFFCFRCGRMGHSKWECSDDEEESSEEEAEDEARKRKRFGEWIRESPLKKYKMQNTTIPAAPQRVNRALNFTGAQLQKIQAASSATHDNHGRSRRKKTSNQLLLEGADLESTPKKLPAGISNSLASSVQKLVMSDPVPDLNASLQSGG